ncbi:MAG: PhoU domain-containing protein, partial [Rhodospirillales bacterium]
MSSEHTVKAFDEQLKRLDHLIAEMGGLAETQLANAIEALIKRDGDKALRVVGVDMRLDEL